VCGNSFQTPGEGCDDGNIAAGDGCSNHCSTECGFVCNATEPQVCVSKCGDGIRASDEACDDGNTADDDGCNSSCNATEPGWKCNATTECQQTRCEQCAAGKFETGGVCQDCPEGTHLSTEGGSSSEDCVECEAGKYSNNALTACDACPDGSNAAEKSTNLTACKCNAGWTGPDGGPCAECAMGKFRSEIGSGECASCVTGTYLDETGHDDAGDCKLCPLDSGNNAAASTAQTDCKCDLGFTGPDGDPCAECARGKYKASAGDMSCDECAHGKYLNVAGSDSETDCETCPSNSGNNPVASKDVTDCICDAGSTGPDGGLCTQCVAGKYKIASGDAACSNCSAGQYSTANGATSNVCQGCTSNSNAPEASDKEINFICNAGSSGPDGVAGCSECIAGTWKAVNGSSSCILCASGKYSTEPAQMSEAACDDCPAHSYSSNGSNMITNCTCHAGYSGPDGSDCQACVAGTWKAVNGSSSCTLCTSGKYSSETGEIAESTCTECPATTYSGDGSGLPTNCICNRGYTGEDGAVCSECIAGTWKAVNGSSSCILCASGKYSTEPAQMSEAACDDCPAHSYSSDGSNMITNCTCWLHRPSRRALYPV